MAKKVTKATSADDNLEVTENLDEETEETTEEDISVVEATAEIGAVAKVKIKVKQKVESYIGDRFYRFEAGQEYNVPKNVKDILKNAGYLETL